MKKHVEIGGQNAATEAKHGRKVGAAVLKPMKGSYIVQDGAKIKKDLKSAKKLGEDSASKFW
jgi:hypothetical protein